MGKARIRWASRAGALMLLMAGGTFLTWAVLFAINLQARFQAQSLVIAVRSMRVGSTTLEETRPLLARYRANALGATYTRQYSADIGFVIHVGHEHIEELGERFYFLRYAGLAPWGVGTEMYFRSGRLCELRLGAGTEVNKKEGFREGVDLSTEQSLGNKEFEMSGGHMTGGSRYIFFRVHTVRLPADATSTERAHAFAYDLACVTKLGGCQDVAQLLALKLVRQDWDARHSD